MSTPYWKSLSLVCFCLSSLPMKKPNTRRSERFCSTFAQAIALVTYIHNSMLNTERKSTGFESTSQSCDVFRLGMRKSGSCMLGGSAPIKWQTCLYTCMSIKRGRSINIAVFRGSVVNAFEAGDPWLSLPERLSALRTEISGCIIVQLSSNAFV